MVSIELSDDIFSGNEQKLKELFKIDTDKSIDDQNLEFQNKIQEVTCAALSEYMEMFLGMGLPSRSDEILQQRLYFLIKYYFKETIPSESDVSSHFQITRSKSRSLIRSVMTRYHHKLENQMKKTLKKTIELKIDDPNDENLYQLKITSDNVLEQLKAIQDKEAPELDRLRKVKNSSRMFYISKRSYDKLKDFL
jgi:hypothetical protein